VDTAAGARPPVLPPPVLEVRGVTKLFGATRALDGVSFALRAGEVHGLAGENGAGKSTLIKVLTGLHQPDAGEILLGGEAVRFAGPRDSQRLGISAVYQEINLIPERSVAENIFLGREPKRAGLLDRQRMKADARAVLARYGLDLDPASRLRSLGLGLQQMVSIARAASLGAQVVIMDEPTSALSAAEVETLFGVVERLRAEGVAILFVSHRLSECYRLCDQLTVLRDGRVVRTGTAAELPRAELVAAMLGQELGQQERGQHAEATRRPASQDSGEAPVLRLHNLWWRSRVRGVALDVRRREIVGLAGLLGSGRTETLKAAFGAERPERGAIEVAGHAMRDPSPARSIRHGLGFLSEDRRAEGIFPRLSVRENTTASVLPLISRFGIVSRRREDEMVRRFIAQLGIKTAGPGQAITGLSGGNQQKVLLARCLCTRPRALMLDDPTRGIDVGAKAEVHRAIRALAADGLGVLVTSSEMEELLALSDRLVVLSEGSVAGEVEGGSASPDQVLDLLASHAPG
jgi:monosaccharide-transporting ATPase